MAEALWSANSGVDFSAEEDRRLIGAIWPQTGVLDGLTVTPGTGRAVSISSGRCVIPDGEGGSYLAYFDSATTNLAIAANVGAARTDGIYVTVDDPGTGEATVVAVTGNTPVPTDPYVLLATVAVATNASSFVTGNINNLVRNTPLDARYFPASKITYGTVAALPTTLAVGAIYLAHE